ncbi:uncharacterized protein N7459_007940 [Penicillium hispanicum]|uniref:uncharacterized protein n=1 Tax=Penicillium hispanicum TaxID=1080232 RepID=UPI002540F469|nr:uncharacterized protein N7459_007940 [Penicillium hispanicum]KAJ5573513.1 hypothetical protein N7459_007940 [Penicillium hispanicum]
MFTKAANSTPAVPSRNALRVLRQLALAGSTVGGFCAVATITYDVHRRVRVAEQIIENKRTLRTSAPNYDATSSAKRLTAMMEAAEAGEFLGLESLKRREAALRSEPKNAPDEEDIVDYSFMPPSRPPKPRPPFAMNRIGAFNLPRPADARSTARNQIALAREAQEADQAVAAGDLPLEDALRDFLKNGRDIDAANLFLNHVPPSLDEPISWERREIAREVFTANCARGNLYIARSVFERLEKVTVMDTEIWTMMMHLLAKEGHIDSAAAIFERHRTKLIVPGHMLEVVLRCLLESRRLGAAKWLFYARIKHDENGGLCGAFLDGIWRKTRNSKVLADEFRHIVTSLANLERKPTEKVFNPLIKAYVEAGKFEDAEALVEDMPGKFGVQPGCRTMGLLVYGRALECNWDGVMAGLREMHELGFTRQKQNFANVFDRVFLEYYPAHSGPQIFDFLMACINEFHIVPDKILHRHMLEAMVERGDADLVGKIIRMANKRKWNTGLDQEELVHILEARRVSMEDTPVGFWRMLQAAKKQYGQVASSRRLMGSSAESYSLDRGVLKPIHIPAEEVYPKSMQNLSGSKSINVYIPLHKRMEHYIHIGKFPAALECFRRANGAGYPIKPIHIQLAVIAHILYEGIAGLKPARDLIRHEWPYWAKLPTVRHTPRFPRFVPLFFQQLMQLDIARVRDGLLMKMALFEFYRLCVDTPNLNFKHHASVAISRRLIQFGRPKVAISILEAVYISKWRKEYGFDQVQLKMLLRAFAVVGFARGVWWCLLTVLSRHEPIKLEFVVEAERLLPTLLKHFDHPDRLAQPTLKLDVLKRILWALRKKHEGNAYWSQYKSEPARKQKYRAYVAQLNTLEQRRLPNTSLEEMIQNFDEEMEMEILLQRKPYTPEEVETWWSEQFLMFQTKKQPENPTYPEFDKFAPWREEHLAQLRITNPELFA